MALGFGSDFRFDIFARDRTGPAWRGVESGMQRTQRAASGLLRAVGPLIGVGGAAIGATVLAQMARQSLEFADNLVQAADRTAFAVDRLEELRYAGRQNQVQFEATDMALQRFSRRLAEAANGSGELERDLADAGVALRDADGRMRDSYDILLDYADAVAAAGSGQEQLRMAFKAFDSEGAAFVNVLRLGREGIEQYAEEARAAGAVMGDELARNAQAANRSLTQMQQTLQGQFNQAVAENAEDLANFADMLSLIIQLAIKAASAIGGIFDDVRADVQATPQERRLGMLRNTRRLLQSRIDNNQVAIEEARGDSRYQRLADDAARENEDLQSRIDQLNQLIDETELRMQQEQSRRAGSDIRNQPPETTPPRPSVWDDADSGQDVAAMGPTPRYNPRSDAAAREWLATMEEFTSLKAEQFASDVVKAELDEYLAHREEFSRATGAFFADGVMAAFDGNLEEFLRERLRQAAYDGLYNAITDAAGYLLDALRGSGGEGGSWISRAADVVFGGGKAGGGPAQPGMVYRVGERGPEDVVFGAPAHVLNADQSARTGMTQVHQHFHLHAEGAVMTAELLTQMEAKANASAANAVAPVVGAAQRQAKRSAYGLNRK